MGTELTPDKGELVLLYLVGEIYLWYFLRPALRCTFPLHRGGKGNKIPGVSSFHLAILCSFIQARRDWGHGWEPPTPTAMLLCSYQDTPLTLPSAQLPEAGSHASLHPSEDPNLAQASSHSLFRQSEGHGLLGYLEANMDSDTYWLYYHGPGAFSL